MMDSSSSLQTNDFTDVQKQYLQGFFAGMAQRLPFAGLTAGGTLTNDPQKSHVNLAAAPPADEPTFWGTPISDLCAEEVWKYERNPLDCWDDLLRHAAENRAPDAEFRYRFKTFGLFHVAPAQDSFMLRMRVPGGVLQASQLRGIANMAGRWGCSRIDLTTRANLQLRELQPRSIVDVLNTLQKLGMTSRGAGADNLRNFTASPLSGFDPTELIDVQPYADALQNYVSNSRDMFGLPRKFNIAFDSGGRISVLADTNDIGFVAVRVPEGRSVPAGIYFRALLCGITGHKQFAADCGLLLLPDQLVAVGASMIRVFAEHADRTDRKKARLKYLVDRWGVTKFLDEVQKRLDFPIIHCGTSECEARGPIDRAGHIGSHPQVQLRQNYLGIVTPVGWLPASQAHALADIADRFGSGELRLTVWQNVILPNIATENLEAAKAAVHEAGLEFEAGRVLSGTVACTGSRGCRFAMTDTKGHALEIARTLDSLFQIDQPVNLHVTGCPNSCAQHYIGDIGLMGVKVSGAEGYQVNLGGGAENDQGFARELFPAMPYDDLLPALQALFAAFQHNRRNEESFLEFARRHALEDLRDMCVTAGVAQRSVA